MKRYFFRAHNSNENIFKYLIHSFKARPLIPISLLVLIILIPIFILSSKYLNPKSEAAWFDESFQYRKAVDITNTSGGILTDFQVSISVGTSAPIATGKMKSDCSDIRITDQNGNILPHWIEENNPGCNAITDAKVWVKVPSIPTSGATLYVYYGNPSAASISNGKNVFLEFDDFNNSSTIVNWKPESNPATIYSISGGSMNVTVPSGGYGSAVFGDIYTDVIVNSRFKVNSSQTHGGFLFRAQSIAADNSYQWVIRGTSNDNRFQRRQSGSQYYYSGLNNTVLPSALVANTWYPVEFKLSGSMVSTYFNNQLSVNGDLADSIYTSGKVGFLSYDGTEYYDYIFIRKYVSSQPTANLSITEEKSLGPVAYWKFDEGVGSTVYDSGSSKSNGSLGAGSSAPTWVEDSQCISGKCLSFNGTQAAYSNYDASWNNANNISMGFWVKPQNVTDSQKGIIGKQYPNYEWSIYQSGSAISLVYWNTSGGHTNGMDDTWGSILVANNWTYLTYTWDGSTSRFYANGKLMKEKIATDPSINMNRTNGMMFGGNIYTWADTYFKGVLDDVKIYTYVRTADQIKSDYNSGISRQSSAKGTSASMGSPGVSNLSNGLVGYWKMDESSAGTGSTAYDASGNGNNGIGTGTSWSFLKYGSSLTFDGSNDSISLAQQAINNATIWTVNTRLKYITQSKAFEFFLGRFDGGSTGKILLRNNGKISFRATNSTYYDFSVNSSEIDGVYSELSFVSDGTTIKLYVNGILRSTIIPASTSFSIDLIGNAWSDTAWTCALILDDLRIYNRALSQNEIKDLYNFVPGPIAYWNFEEGSGSTANDKSGNGNNAAFGVGNSAPLWDIGKYGNGLKYDGTNDVLNSSSNIRPVDFTASMWIYPTSYSSQPYTALLSNRSTGSDGLMLFTYAGGALNFDWGDGSSSHRWNTGYQPVLNQWTHVTISRNVNGRYLYINGQLQNSTVDAGGPITTNNNMSIGWASLGGPYHFQGNMDEVKIYNYARTQGQIISDMNGGHPLGGSPVGSQVGYWKFDEGYGNVANNSGSGGSTINGTISGSTWNNNGKFGKALNFNGSTDRVVLNTSINTPNISISAWINPQTPTEYYSCIFSNLNYNTDNGYGLLFSSTSLNNLYFYIGNESIGTNSSGIIAGNWYYVLATWNGTTAKLFINNKLVASNNLGTPTGYNGATDMIGEYTGYNFNGLIDEVKIYNAALSDDEIKIDYNRGQAMQMGSLSSGAGNTAPSNAASQEYCVPGDTNPCTAPVGEWKFEENTGTTTADVSGNNNLGNFGTGNSAPSWTLGKNGYALKFDGSNDFIQLSQNVTLQNTNWTVSAWSKTSAGENTIVGNKSGGPAYNAFQISTSKMSYYHYNGSWVREYGATNVADGQWHYLTWSNVGATQRVDLYVDGKWDANVSSSIVGGAGLVDVIGRYWSSNMFYNGLIDDVRIYNYTRTPAQIAWDYNKGAPVGWWKMDECQGNVLNDASGNKNNGTINIGVGGSQASVGTCSMVGTAWGNGKAGKINYSLNFDGVDDNIQIGSNFGIFPGYTISFWAKHNVANKMPIASMVDASFYWFGDNSWRYTHGGVGAEFYYPKTVSIPYGTWGYFTVTYDGANVRIYRNGILEGSQPSTGTANFSNGLFIGDWSSSSTYRFNGQIDDVRIYNYPLTSTQVKSLYNNGAISFGPSSGAP